MASFGSATLILNGPRSSASIQIHQTKVSVGRDAQDNDLVLQEPGVAPHHCEFVSEDGYLILRDQNSPGGTFINGRRIHAARIFDGDLVRIGELEGRIEVRSPGGRPIRAPRERGFMTIAAAFFGILLVGGSAVTGWIVAQRLRERELFVEYEVEARSFLQIPSPCAVAHDTIQRVADTEVMLEKLGLPGTGKRVRPLEPEQNERLLLLSEQRESHLGPLLTALDTDVDRPLHSQFDVLRSLSGRFRQRQFVDAARGLQLLFQEQVAAHERFRTGLEQYRTQVAHVNDQLRQAKASDTQTVATSESAPKLLRAMDLQTACEATFADLSAQAMLKLASVSL